MYIFIMFIYQFNFLVISLRRVSMIFRATDTGNYANGV